MDYISHTVGGVVLATGIAYVSSKLGVESNVVPLLAGGAVGALLPDIDTPYSFLGSKVKPLSNILHDTVGHRTLTHSLLFAMIIGLLIGLFSPWLGVGVAIGILSHILLDMPSRMGVAYLYPFKKKRIRWF